MKREEIYKTIPSQNSNKKPRDAYYTPDWLAEKLFKTVDNVIGDEVIKYIEPSAGNGVWLKYLNKPYIAYDIAPMANGILKEDFLNVEIKYQNGICLIGNPPFGRSGNLMSAFIKKGMEIADYVAFILPVSQYQNNYKFWQFDLIYSENLGSIDFDGYMINCCFNIYKRPLIKKKKPKLELKNIKIEERTTIKKGEHKERSNQYSDNNYDFRICTWGQSAGKIIEDENKTYAKEIAFWINDEKLREKVYSLFKNKNILDYFPQTSTPNIVKWQVVKFIKDNIEIQKGIN